MRENLVLRTAVSRMLPMLDALHDEILLSWTRASTKTAATISTEQALIEWVRGPLRGLMEHQSTVLGFGHVHYGGYAVDRVLCVDVPASFTADLRLPSGALCCPPLAKWLETHEPQMIEPQQYCAEQDAQWVCSLLKHGIENGIVDGGVDIQSGRMTFVLLLNLANMPEQFKGLIHSACTNFLGDAWQRISDLETSEHVQQMSQVHILVSPAERQVLELLRLGKTNWEIGQILGKSELTIKTQLRRMYVKTHTANRTQLSALIP